MENRDLRKRLAAFAAAVMMTGTAFAADPYVLDDFENKDYGSDVMNYNNGAWYLYDDNAPSWNKKTYDKDANKYTDADGMLPGGNSKFVKMNDTEITEADMKQKLIKNDNGDTLKVEAIYPNATATKGAGSDGGDDRGLKLEFKLGNKKPQHGHKDDETYDGFVGFGTGLVPEGKFQPLSGEMEVSFKAKVEMSDITKSLTDHLDVEFNIQTNQFVIKLHGATYKVMCKVTEEWQTFTYKLDFGHDADEDKKDNVEKKFYQHHWWHEWDSKATEAWFGWESTEEEFTGLIEAAPLWGQSEKLQWVIKNPTDAAKNNGFFAEQNTIIYIDDITIKGYTPTFDDEIQADKAWKDHSDDKALVIYETGSDNIIGTGNGWYTYDDTKNDDGTAGKGTSNISEKIIDTEKDHVGIKFTLGDTFEKEIEGKNVLIFPFVGLAVGMYADAAKEEGDYDYTKDGYNGVKFKYKTVGDGIDWVQLRMKDNQVLKADGATFNVKVPGTSGEWKTATVSLDDLNLPWWDDKDGNLSFKKTNGRTIEFAYEGTPGQTGELYVDDLTLITNAEVKTPDIEPVVNPKKAVSAANFNVALNSNGINLTLPTGVNKAKVMLYSLKGQLVSSQIVDNGVTNAVISTENLAANTYVLRAVSLEGAQVNFAKAISIVK